MLDIFYHPIYTYGIDERCRFPRDRYRLIHEKLTKYKNEINFVEPGMIDVEDIYLAHDQSYVDSFFNNTLSKEVKRKIGLQPWNSFIFDRTRYILGGSLGAMERAIKKNTVAANLAGGTHHAFHTFGSGYCIFNDLAICALKCIEMYEKINNIIIIDLDVHQGDGTASIFTGKKKVFTFSMHCDSNFPLKKMKSNIDIPLEKGTGDEQYIQILKKNIRIIEQMNYDIIFFQAGVDILSKDSMGHLNITKNGIKQRNELILNLSENKNIPLVIFMGGGYSKPISHTVDSFVDLFLQSAKYC
ncbi:MAG: histone deacetylase [Candidatus Marinimicrobia bacterium]|nr:histone deacetylase [Candidatus Neomarinimicrobiota bacterium]